MKKESLFSSVLSVSVLFTVMLSSFDSKSQGASNKLAIAEVFEKGTSLQSVTSNTLKQTNTGLHLSTLAFTGSDLTKDTRRPQGIALMDQYVINSWYFTDKSTSWKNNCKLTITDTVKGQYFNLVPVQLSASSSKYKHIDSHAGGLTIIDHYLYMVDNYDSETTQVIRIFDLNKIVLRNNNDIQSGEKFIKEYVYLLPEVDRIVVDTDNDFNLSYLSTATINGKKYFLTGNFYMNTTDYKKGGKSHILLLPIKDNPNSFSTIDTSKVRKTISPQYPPGTNHGNTVSRIQGAIVSENTLIISRSYSNQTNQLLILEYDDILTDNPTLKGFFSGTNTDQHNYNNKNWLVGCEDLCYDQKTGDIYTVTEFRESLRGSGRKIYSGKFSDFMGLIKVITKSN